jgi:hypothetical protein
MKNIAIIKDVLATMGVALNKEAFVAQGIDCRLFNEFNPDELSAAGFDREILTAAGFVKDS